MTATIPQLVELLNTMGSDVMYHREEPGSPCPCLTPEGFRDPAWHRTHVQGDSIYTPLPVSLQAAVDNAFANTQQPDGIDVAIFFAWVVDQYTTLVVNTYGRGFTDYTEAMQSLVDAGVSTAQTDWGLLGSSKVDGAGRQWFFSTIPGVALDNYPDMTTTSHTAATGDFNMQSIGVAKTQYMTNPMCNEEGIIPFVTTAPVKASIQPATLGQRGRAAERANQLLGEIQRDDHFGIFPVTWGGVTLDFSAFSDSGDDFIVYDGRRFLVVAADKIPDIDGDPNHHWEVGLRLIKSKRPL